jgi:alcohol dehydrogenase (cytochrome c)
LLPGNDYSGQRFSSASQISASNVARLAPVCSYSVPDAPSFQTNPLVDRGHMYLTTLEATIALDAVTCRELWRLNRKPWRVPEFPNNRGAAVLDGLVIRGTADGYLIAMDAGTGSVRWQRQVADGAGEMLTMPPLVVDSLVIIGPAGSERLVEGWVGAFKIRDGSEVWRFRTFPKGGPAAETWTIADTADVGGATLWTPLSFDVNTHMLYLSTSNPAPDHIGDVRLGANLYSNSIVALDAHTGTLRWHRQLVPHDTHDHDVTHAGPLFDIDGQKLIATAGKDGMVYVLDRQTGAIVSSTEVSRRYNLSAAIDTSGTYACPGKFGGVSHGGLAYSPVTQLIYVPSLDLCGSFHRFSRVRRRSQRVQGVGHDGGWFRADYGTQAGYVTAIDPISGDIRWRYKSPLPIIGSVLATPDLLFAGEMSGDLVALDAATGSVLLRTPIGGAVGGGIVTYTIAARQYIGVVSGRPTVTIPAPATSGEPRLTVYALP